MVSRYVKPGKNEEKLWEFWKGSRDQGNKDFPPPPPPLLGDLTISLAVCTYVLNSKSFGKVSTKSESE